MQQAIVLLGCVTFPNWKYFLQQTSSSRFSFIKKNEEETGVFDTSIH